MDDLRTIATDRRSSIDDPILKSCRNPCGCYVFLYSILELGGLLPFPTQQRSGFRTSLMHNTSVFAVLRLDTKNIVDRIDDVHALVAGRTNKVLHFNLSIFLLFKASTKIRMTDLITSVSVNLLAPATAAPRRTT